MSSGVDAALGVVQAALASITPHHDEFALQERLRPGWTGAWLPDLDWPAFHCLHKRRDLLLGNQERAPIATKKERTADHLSSDRRLGW